MVLLPQPVEDHRRAVIGWLSEERWQRNRRKDSIHPRWNDRDGEDMRSAGPTPYHIAGGCRHGDRDGYEVGRNSPQVMAGRNNPLENLREGEPKASPSIRNDHRYIAGIIPVNELENTSNKHPSSPGYIQYNRYQISRTVHLWVPPLHADGRMNFATNPGMAGLAEGLMGPAARSTCNTTPSPTTVEQPA